MGLMTGWGLLLSTYSTMASLSSATRRPRGPSPSSTASGVCPVFCWICSDIWSPWLGGWCEVVQVDGDLAGLAAALARDDARTDVDSVGDGLGANRAGVVGISDLRLVDDDGPVGGPHHVQHDG